MKDSQAPKTQKSAMSKFRKTLASKKVILVFVILFAVIGTYLLFHSLASGNFVAQEAEGGTLSSPAAVVADSTASGGKALQFNAPSAAGAFLSYPYQSGPQSFSGSNVVVANRSYVNLSTTKAVLVVSNANNVYLHDLDFDSNCGDIFLINVTGQIRIENIRARNTGGPSSLCPIGSGHKNVIQLNNSFDNGTGGIRNVKIYGGQTEDAISIFQSGGTDSAHPLIIENNHIEHPLPPDPLAWQSGTGTCINLGDGGGGYVIARNNTFLNCGAVGIQMNKVSFATASNNILYGATRASANVGLSQYGTCSTPCTGDQYLNNRVNWKNSSGGSNNVYINHTEYFTIDPKSAASGNVYPDSNIDPNSLKVVL